MRYGIIALLVFCVCGSQAQAHTRHRSQNPVAVGVGYGLAHMLAGIHRHHHRYVHYRVHSDTFQHTAEIVAHPSGCPRTAFCGCGTAVKIFGYAKRSLWLAEAWFQFPPAAPGPGMVAVRRHHVFAILEAYGDGTVLAYDPNSGRGMTRIHRISLAGYSVRNPHGRDYAYL